jgi:uncharacterized protein YecT (DUF1311 family)
MGSGVHDLHCPPQLFSLRINLINKRARMQLSDFFKDAALLLLGGMGTAIWFFWRRRAEQKPIFENIQKAEKLLFLQKELDNTNYTVDDLKNLEDALTGRAKIAKELSLSFKQEAKEIRQIESMNEMTQSEMNIVGGQAYERAKRKLERIILEIKEFYSPEESARFDETNEAWRIYQRKHADFQASQYRGGSIQPLMYASTLEAVTIARIVELEKELKFMKVTQVPYHEREPS